MYCVNYVYIIQKFWILNLQSHFVSYLLAKGLWIYLYIVVVLVYVGTRTIVQGSVIKYFCYDKKKVGQIILVFSWWLTLST